MAEAIRQTASDADAKEREKNRRLRGF